MELTISATKLGWPQVYTYRKDPGMPIKRGIGYYISKSTLWSLKKFGGG